MPQPVGKHNLHQQLTAFADGELDAAQTFALLEYLLEHPASLEASLAMMRDQQRLRLAAERLVRAEVRPPSEALHARVAELSVPAPDGSHDPPPDPTRHRAGPRARTWLVAGLIVLLAGVVVGRYALPRPPRSTPDIVADAPDRIVPVAVVVKAGRVHADCARLADALHAADYAREHGELAAAMRQELSGPNAYPDLSAAGFRYVGGGPCPDPMQGTVHLLYRESGAQPQLAISLFLQSNAGQYPAVQPGRLYEVSGPRSPFPMYVWRTARVVCFLLADDADAAAAALGVMKAVPSPNRP